MAAGAVMTGYRRPALFSRPAGGRPLKGRRSNMLLMIAGVILVLWLLGLVAIPATGGLINLLLIVALVVIVLHFLGIGRSTATE